MAKAGIIQLSSNIEKRLKEMVQQANRTRDFLERVVYKTYLKAQMKRWMSEGRSDGFGSLPGWKALNAQYAEQKKVRFAEFPGRGKKMLIATNRLFNATTGKGPGHKKIVSEKSVIVGVDVPYAKYVNADRPFFIFSDEMMTGLKNKYRKFVTERGAVS